MARVDLSFDAAVDVDGRVTRPQTFGSPPEFEADTAGLLYFGETLDGDPVEFVLVPGPQGPPGVADDSFALVLGDDLATDDTSPWDTGAVPLTPATTAGAALALLNKKLALAATAADVTAIQVQIANLVFQGVDMPLGEDVATDDLSLWNGGAVPLGPADTVGYAVSRLNHKISEVLLTLANGVGAQDGFEMPLGDVVAHGDGAWTPGAVALDGTVKVSEAVDRLNEVLGLLVPSQPPNFPNGSLSISNTAGASPLLASGVADNSGGGSGYAAGGAVTRITAGGASSFAFNDVGPGNSGVVQVFVNGTLSDSHALTGAGDNGTYGALVLGDQKDFPPAQPGFWKSIDISVANAAVAAGINKLKVVHTGAGASNEAFFVRDTMTAGPAISAPSVTEATAGVPAYSSGVPHYNTGAALNVNLSVSNLSGETYYGGADPLVIAGSNAIISANTKGYAALGVATPIPRQTTAATAITQQTIAIDGANVHNVGQVQATAKNVNGSSGAQAFGPSILVKRGAAGGRIDENAVTVTGLGAGANAVRKAMGSGDTPIGAGAVWNSQAPLQASDAAVVAGVLKHDQTDYTGYLPSGPDLSVGRGGAQYVTFSFNRAARSTFKINISGAYSACKIKLPGVSDDAAISPSAANGWWDAFQSYGGAGVPGQAGDAAAGCALGGVMNGGGGSFTITFGTQSSTNAIGNEILVRLKLAPGQSIPTLTFSN